MDRVRVLFLALVLAFAMAPAQAASPAYQEAIAQAEAGLQAGQWQGAASAAKVAFGAGETDDERVHAARLVASAYFRAKQYFRAELWLRRAHQHAKSILAVQAVASDAATLRRISPWTTRLSFSLAPNSNVNNGSQSEIVTIWGLPFVLNADARALAGYEMAAGVQAAYRLSEDQAHRTEAGFAASGRTFWLSAAAAAAAPGVSGGDYAFANVEAFVRHGWRHRAANGPASVQLALGRNWYGGAVYSDYGRLALSQEIVSAQGTAWAASLGLEQQRISASGISTNTVSVSAQRRRKLANGDQIALNAGLQDTRSADPFSANRGGSVGAQYQLAQPVFSARLALSLGAEARIWPLSVYDPSGRLDISVTLAADFALQGPVVYGFAPVIRVEASSSQSNIALFDRLSYGLRFGVQSQF